MRYIDVRTYFEIIRCDICGVEISQVAEDKWQRDFVARVRAAGWKIGKRHICPNHQQPKLLLGG